MGNIMQTDLGNITISKNVIATIAGHAVAQCYGLVGMSSKNIKHSFAGRLGLEALQKGVIVKTDNDKLIIELHIVVSYGTKISEVSQNVIDRVRYEVEFATGLQVDEVNVFVQGVRVIE